MACGTYATVLEANNPDCLLSTGSEARSRIRSDSFAPATSRRQGAAFLRENQSACNNWGTFQSIQLRALPMSEIGKHQEQYLLSRENMKSREMCTPLTSLAIALTNPSIFVYLYCTRAIACCSNARSTKSTCCEWPTKRSCSRQWTMLKLLSPTSSTKTSYAGAAAAATFSSRSVFVPVF